MVKILGHYVSLRSILFAVFEIAAFTALFNIVKVGAVYVALGGFQDLPHQTFVLVMACVISFSTAAACGMYNKEIFTDSEGLITKLLTSSVLMYFLMAVSISVLELLSTETTNYKLYYAITLGASAGFYVVALLFRLNLFATDFNDTALERRVLVVGADERAAKIALIRSLSRSPFKTIGFVPIGDAACAPQLRPLLVAPEAVSAAGGLAAFAEDKGIDEVVFASREQRGVDLRDLLECKLRGMIVTDYPSFWERQTGQIDLNEVSPSWMVFSSGFSVN
jgi:FlaA1/EpsC-like NDP-sugar epimerase